MTNNFYRDQALNNAEHDLKKLKELKLRKETMSLFERIKFNIKGLFYETPEDAVRRLSTAY
jgi:hypothetical protein